MPIYTYKCAQRHEHTEKMRYEDFTPWMWCLREVGDNVCGLSMRVVVQPTPFIVKG